MPTTDLPSWFEEHAVEGKIWLVKRLSANDTGLTGSHQAGPLIPKSLLFLLFPQLNDKNNNYPTVKLTVVSDSHAAIFDDARAKWYWSKGEGRFTRVGGSNGPFLDRENTGAIAVFVFDENEDSSNRTCHTWVCEGNGTEDDFIEEMLQPIEPRQFFIWRPGTSPAQSDLFLNSQRSGYCNLSDSLIPEEWKKKFPSGIEIIEKAKSLRSLQSINIDLRIIKRRECEFELFKSIESFHFKPVIKNGFDNIDSFLSIAQTIIQARKSRSGKSLEYHAKNIFEEEGLIENINFSHDKISEFGKRPDFIFPSVSAYNDSSFPKEKLMMLACKTTAKDRWRQVISEADRIKIKHLLTLQEGISENQFKEMVNAGIKLVVPRKIHSKYPNSIRNELMSLEEFLGDVRAASS